MSRTAAVALGAAGVVALLAALAVRPRHETHQTPSAPGSSESVAEQVATAAEPRQLAPIASVVAAPSVQPRAAPSAAPSSAKPVDEASLLAKLHDLAASDPLLSLKLAREAVERFPDSPNAPEFEWNVVKALFNMHRIEEAKDEARIMLWKYPDNYYALDVEHHLLNHPPNPPGTPVTP